VPSYPLRIHRNPQYFTHSMVLSKDSPLVYIAVFIPMEFKKLSTGSARIPVIFSEVWFLLQLNNIIFTTKKLETIESNEIFEANYRRVIGASRRFDPQDNSAIWIWNRFTDYMRTQNAMGMLRTAIWVIGIFTLLSGIVGVSNIMLITVKERTREFGIRKALGAKPLSILWLIIVESVAITTLFGYIGMVAGIAVTEWMNSAFGNQTMDAGMFQQTMFSNPTVDLSVAIQATLTLIIAGTLAGFFPAKKAVSISPIEALRAD